MAEKNTPALNAAKVKAVIQRIVRLYEEIAGLDEPSLDKLKVQLLKAYPLAVRQLVAIERAEKAATKQTGTK